MSYPPRHFPAPSSRAEPLEIRSYLDRQHVDAMRPPVRLIRISVLDLIVAARALCVLPDEAGREGFAVVAAGHSFATLSLTERQCQKLTEARVHWQPDA